MAEQARATQLSSRAAEAEPSAADLLDPIALEARLVEARARRAAALAQRSGEGSASRGVATVERLAEPSPPAAVPAPPVAPEKTPDPAAPVASGDRDKRSAGRHVPLLLVFMFVAGLVGAGVAALLAPPSMRQRIAEAIAPGAGDRPAETETVAAPAPRDTDAPPARPDAGIVAETAAPDRPPPEIDLPAKATPQPSAIERPPSVVAADAGADVPTLARMPQARLPVVTASAAMRSAVPRPDVVIPARTDAGAAADPAGVAATRPSDPARPSRPGAVREAARVAPGREAGSRIAAVTRPTQIRSPSLAAAPLPGGLPAAPEIADTPSITGWPGAGGAVPARAAGQVAALTAGPAQPAPDPTPTALPPTVVVHYPPDAGAAADTALEALGAAGATGVSVVPVSFTVSRTNIRFYHAADLAGAEGVADLLSERFGDPGITARDFTEFRPQPEDGYVEVWLAGDAPVARAAPPPAPAAAPRAAAAVRQGRPVVSRPAAVQGTSRDALQRAVERMLREELNTN